MSDGRSSGGDSDAGGDAPPAGADDLASAGDDWDRFTRMSTHFYRAEVDRMITWRTRLDQTTNWTVVVLAAVLTWAFSSPGHPHYVILVGALTTVVFLLVEAQRYQEYDAWRKRVRLLQESLFAEIYAPEETDARGMLRHLGEDLRNPSIRIPFWEAVSHRLAHIYLALLTIVLAAWSARVTVFARKPLATAAAIAVVPGAVVVAVVGLAYLVAVGLAMWSFVRAPRREFTADVDVVRPEDET